MKYYCKKKTFTFSCSMSRKYCLSIAYAESKWKRPNCSFKFFFYIPSKEPLLVIPEHSK